MHCSALYRFSQGLEISKPNQMIEYFAKVCNKVQKLVQASFHFSETMADLKRFTAPGKQTIGLDKMCFLRLTLGRVMILTWNKNQFFPV